MVMGRIYHLPALVVMFLAMHFPPSTLATSVNDIIADVKAGKRYLFTAALDGSKLLLFISGSGGSIDFSNGYQLEAPGEPVKGVFGKLDHAKKLSEYSNAKFDADELIFATRDTKGNQLVGMSKKVVNVLTLSSGNFATLAVKGEDLNNCFRYGALHISSSDTGTYYLLNSKGRLHKGTFDNADSVVLAEICNAKPLGNLCYSDKKILVSDSCKDSPPPNIISGFVTSSTVYLFNKDGNLYFFSSSAFSTASTSAEVTVVKAEQVWQSSAPVVSSSRPNGSSPNSATSAFPVAAVIAGVLALLLLLLVISIIVYCKCFSGSAKKKQEKGKNQQQQQTMKKNKSGQSKEKKKRSKSPGSKKGRQSLKGRQSSSRKNAPSPSKRKRVAGSSASQLSSTASAAAASSSKQ